MTDDRDDPQQPGEHPDDIEFPDQLPPADEQGTAPEGAVYDEGIPAYASTEVIGAPPTPSRRVGRLTLALVIVILAGIGAGVGVLLTSSKTQKSLDQLVPSDVAVYVSVHARPQGQQADALNALESKLSSSQRAQVSSAIDNALQSIVDRALSSGFFATRGGIRWHAAASSGFSWKTDFEPWIGDNVAVAVSDGGGRQPAVVLLADVKDAGKARSTLDRVKARAGSSFVYTIADGVAYISSTEANITSLRSRAQSDPVGSSTTFQTDRDRVQGADSLGLVWVNSSALQAMLARIRPGATSAGGAALQDATVSVRVEPQGFAMNSATKLFPGFTFGSGTPSLVESSPATQVASLTFFDLGNIIDQGLRLVSQLGGGRPEGPVAAIGAIQQMLGIDLQRDLVPWTHGEFSFVFGGISAGGPELGFVIKSTDSAAAARTLAALRARLPVLAAQFHLPIHVKPGPVANSFVVEISGFQLIVVRGSDRVVLASSESYTQQLLHGAAQKLSGDALYQAAMGSPSGKVAFQMFVRLDRVRQLIEVSLPPDAVANYNANVKPILGLFQAFGVRSSIQGDFIYTHALITLAGQ